MTGPNICECYRQPHAAIEEPPPHYFLTAGGMPVPWLIDNRLVFTDVWPRGEVPGGQGDYAYNPFEYYYPPRKRRLAPKGRTRNESVHLEFASLARPTGAPELLAIDDEGGVRMRDRIDKGQGNLLIINQRTPALIRAANRLIRPSSQEHVEEVLGFVRRWGLPEAQETELPSDSWLADNPPPEQLKAELMAMRAGAGPPRLRSEVPSQYSLQRLLYLACELHYAVELWRLLKARRFDEVAIARITRILELLPCAGTRPSVFFRYWGDPHAAVIPVRRRGTPMEDASSVLGDVLTVRVRPARLRPLPSRRGGRVVAEPRWWCPDLMTSMYLMLHLDMTAGHTIASCTRCGGLFHKRPWSRRVGGKREEHLFCCAACREAWKDAHRPKFTGQKNPAKPMDRKSEPRRDSTAKTRRKTKGKADESVALGKGHFKPDVRI